MRSITLSIASLSIGGHPVDPDIVQHARALVVIRDGNTSPGPSDWEVSLQTSQRLPLARGVHDLVIDVADGSRLAGAALVRFSDGTRHLFRGDGDLDGFVDEP